MKAPPAKGDRPPTAFEQWATTKPVVATIPVLGQEVIRFYATRPGALVLRCPAVECSRWFEISQGYTWTPPGMLFSVTPDIHCPSCGDVYGVQGGRFRQ